jgi:hypothetical protein
MKKLISLILVGFASSAFAADVAPVDAVVLNQPLLDGPKGSVALVSVDGTCKYLGEIRGSKRDPKGLGEHIMAAETDDHKVTDWTTTVRTAACFGDGGANEKRPVALKFEGGPNLHPGDHVQLRTIQ